VVAGDHARDHGIATRMQRSVVSEMCVGGKLWPVASLPVSRYRFSRHKFSMKNPEYERRFKLAAYTEKWAVTMSKVRVRQVVSRTPFPRWHLLTFSGPGGGESRGIVDMIAIRKDHSTPRRGLKRGDTFQIILIQVKGGYAAKPTAEDGKRLRIVAREHGACGVLLAAWKKGKAARFYSLRKKATNGKPEWTEVDDLDAVFG